MTRRDAWSAAAVYAALTFYVTWPLPRTLTRDVPSDLGDSLLNMWILAWDCEQLKAIFTGDLARIPRFFDANIFYPSSLTLAYSEHLFPQAIQIFPTYLLTHNIILCYNLLFLSTYVLSGLGAYLLVRELTGNTRAAFLGGLLFAFALYRVPQASHLQVLSSQWMPFALYGFTRYLNTRSVRALGGGSLAAVAQGLSCGYYLLFFVPIAAAYLLWELARRDLWRDRRIWRDVAICGGAAAAVLIPFLMPYARVHEQQQMARGRAEVSQFSADIYSYVTAFPTQRVWGELLQVFPKNEAQLFAGAIPLALGLLAFAKWGVRGWTAVPRASVRGNVVPTVLGVTALVAIVLMTAAIFRRRLVLDLSLFTLQISDLGRVLVLLVLLGAALLFISPRARTRARALLTVEGFFCVALVATWWLSLGPAPQVFGRPLDLPAPYAFLYDVVPGFEGVRVPARYAMVFALLLACAGALALSPIVRGRKGWYVVAIVTVLFLVEAPARVFPMNAVGAGQGYVAPEPRVFPAASAPRIYQHVKRLPADAVLLELPFGEPTWDTFATYYSATHWRSLVNGYSGFFPPGYGLVALGLREPARNPSLAANVLMRSGATHVVVHARAFQPRELEQLTHWLTTTGATLVAHESDDLLYELPR